MSIPEFHLSFLKPLQTLSEFSKKIEKVTKPLRVTNVDKLSLVDQEAVDQNFKARWTLVCDGFGVKVCGHLMRARG